MMWLTGITEEDLSDDVDIVNHDDTISPTGDDYDFDENSSSIMALINKNSWKCRALILKGRSNIGKTSLVRVISSELHYSIHECAADLNQEKFLKENSESTKSENVQIANKKQRKI